MIFPNRFAKKCNICKQIVEIGHGFIQKNADKWITFCKNCCPEKPITDKILKADGTIIMPYNANDVILIKSLPGASWNGQNWTVSIKESDRYRLLEVANKIGLTIPPELNHITLTNASKIALEAGLYPFQVQGSTWLSMRSKGLLGDDMGLGKSCQSLMALPEDGYGLIVAPASLKYNWEQECRKWRKDLIPTILDKKDSFRWPHKKELIIINYEILPDWLKPPTKLPNDKFYKETLKKWEKSIQSKEAENVTLIVDEAHSCKNYKTQRSQKIRNLCGLVKNVWGLTGTPLMNKPIDLYGVLDSLKMSHLVFNGLTHFRQLFGAYQNKFMGWEYGEPSPLVPELLRRVMLRRKREEVLPELPDKTYTVLPVGDLNETLLKQLDDLWNEYKDCLIETRELPSFEKFSEIRRKLAYSRIDSMLEFVENAEEQEVPLVVFCSHLAPLDRLLIREGWAIITGDATLERRQEIVNDFQAGKLKGVGVGIKVGGVGLNLTRAWKALFVDLDWNPAVNLQAESRLIRIGQKANKVEIVRMVSNHPLDLHIMKLLVKKMDLIEKAVN